MKQVPPTNNKKAKIAAGKTQKSGQGYIFTTKQSNPDLANNQKVKDGDLIGVATGGTPVIVIVIVVQRWGSDWGGYRQNTIVIVIVIVVQRWGSDWGGYR